MTSSSPNVVVIYAKCGSQVRGEIRILKRHKRRGSIDSVVDGGVDGGDIPLLSLVGVDTGIFQSFILFVLKVFFQRILEMLTKKKKKKKKVPGKYSLTHRKKSRPSRLSFNTSRSSFFQPAAPPL